MVMWEWRDDGKTHINIYSCGQTDLGRALSNFSPIPEGGEIETPDGPFHTIEGYYFWLGTGDPRFRTCEGSRAKALSKLLPQTQHVSDFKERVAQALQAKLDASPSIQQMLRECTLPLTHYYVMKGRVVAGAAPWILAWWNGARRKLQNDIS